MRATIGILLIIAIFAVPVFAAISSEIAVQGLLYNKSTSLPISGTYNVNFSIYNAVTGGTLLKSSVQSVTISQGVLSSMLNVSGLTFDTDYWLEIKIGSDTFSPRQKLTAAPYALYSSVAGSVSGGVLNVVGSNVGIGTTSPRAKLDVAGGALVNGTLEATDMRTGTLYVAQQLRSGQGILSPPCFGSWQQTTPVGGKTAYVWVCQ